MNSSLCANTSTAGVDYAICLDEVGEEPGWSICPDLTLCNTSQSGDGNVGLAFGLTIGAGLATTLGALLPFIPCVKRANTRILAIGLAVAAGVMLYVSFTEIWTKSRDNFCCLTQDHFDLATTACFFGGILVTILLDLLVSGLQKLECGYCCCCCFPARIRERSLFSHFRGKAGIHKSPVHATNTSIHLESISRNGVPHANGAIQTPSSASGSSVSVSATNLDLTSQGPSLTNGAPPQSNGVPPQITGPLPMLGKADSDSVPPDSVPPDGMSMSVNSVAHSVNTNSYAAISVNELFSNSSLLRMNAVIELEEGEEYDGQSGMTLRSQAECGGLGGQSASQLNMEMGEEEKVSDNGLVQGKAPSGSENDGDSSDSEEALGPKEFREVTKGLGKSTKQLHRMGILTGLAIGIHNFPEGLATFVATLSSPSLGAALAVAIALHNIPEGLCVAMPVYYATGSRVKGFLWAFLSGVSEPLGALLGWLVLQKLFGPLVYGITFGLIAGMMVYISLKELLPTAYRFDSTKGKLVSGCLVFGMVAMAASLILFLY